MAPNKGQFPAGRSGNVKGRAPRRLNAAALDVVTTLAAKGSHLHSIAFAVRCDPRTFAAMLQRDKRAADALAKGRSAWHDFHVSNLNNQAAKGQFAASAYILERKFGYVAANNADDQRPVINITLPAAASLAEYRQSIDVQPIPAKALPEPSK